MPCAGTQSSEPAHKAAEDAIAAHEASVEGGEGTTGEGKGTRAVEERIGEWRKVIMTSQLEEEWC